MTAVNGQAAAPRRATYAVAGWLFLRLLGLVYFVAFVSFGLQIQGLIGSDGMLPAAEFVDAVRQWAGDQHIGLARFHALPTLCWFDCSDRFLAALAVAGAVAAILLALGAVPILSIAFLWVDYLSLVSVGGDFMSFQWDALLLEAGLLAGLLAPLAWRDRWCRRVDPPHLARWLIWWLLFRLMFGSGVVKLASGDPLWSGLTALSVHFETQPIPTPPAWYAHQMPGSFQAASTAGVLVLELAVPWLIFAGRRARLVAAALFITLQTTIGVTGNYAFFNLLTIALSLTLIDDAGFQELFARTRSGEARPSPTIRASTRRWAAVLFALVTVPVSLTILTSQAGLRIRGAAVVTPLRALVAPLRSVNGYGLFAVMTPTRLEIVVEGSDDGQLWQAYEFKYKVGDVRRRPPWVAPYQPRLDWQMWFAALGRYEGEVWLQNFFQRLIDGSPSVLALLETNPFPDRPPRFVRGLLYQYRFADRSTRRRDRVWWVRESLGAYSPVVSRQPKPG